MQNHYKLFINSHRNIESNFDRMAYDVFRSSAILFDGVWLISSLLYVLFSSLLSDGINHITGIAAST